MPIEGKVARILNERDLVINKGAEEGVKEGMKFRVTEPEIAIQDPDTQETLGTLSREKIRVSVVEVLPRFSVGKTYETYTTYPIPELMPPLLPRRVVRKLKTGQGPESKASDESGSFVEVGDPVTQIEDGPYPETATGG